MGVTRYDDLPENRMVRSLQDARQVSRERKGSNQRTGGSNIAFFVSSSANTYDWSGAVNGTSGSTDYGFNQFVVTLTSETAIVPLVDLAATFYYAADGVNFIEYTQEHSSSDSWNFVAPEIHFGLEPLAGTSNATHELKFRVWISARINTVVAFKLQVVGSDEVTIAIARIA